MAEGRRLVGGCAEEGCGVGRGESGGGATVGKQLDAGKVGG